VCRPSLPPQKKLAKQGGKQRGRAIRTTSAGHTPPLDIQHNETIFPALLRNGIFDRLRNEAACHRV
jgi:hypothetical protein